MPEDPAEELAALAEHLTEWLRYQRRLGWRGLPQEPAAAPPTAGEAAAEKVLTLEEIRQEMGRCRRCKLYAGAKNLVFGEGSASARLMFICEAPGAEEDLAGRPFVGVAGQLLDKMLHNLQLDREEVHHQRSQDRPPGNPYPQPDEIEACMPYLVKQIKAIRPQVIVTLGKVATHALLGSSNRLASGVTGSALTTSG